MEQYSLSGGHYYSAEHLYRGGTPAVGGFRRKPVPSSAAMRGKT